MICEEKQIAPNVLDDLFALKVGKLVFYEKIVTQTWMSPSVSNQIVDDSQAYYYNLERECWEWTTPLDGIMTTSPNVVMRDHSTSSAGDLQEFPLTETYRGEGIFVIAYVFFSMGATVTACFF